MKEDSKNDLFEKVPIPRAYFHLCSAGSVQHGGLPGLQYGGYLFYRPDREYRLVAGVSLSAPIFTLMIALGAFLLSVSRQGVIFAIVIFLASKTFGYYGVLASQAVSDCLTAILAAALLFQWMQKEKGSVF